MKGFSSFILIEPNANNSFTLSLPSHVETDLVRFDAGVVINDILDYSKIEAGKLELDPQPFFLCDNVGELIKPRAYRAQSKNLEMICRVDSATPEAMIGDAGMMRQILVNLIGNGNLDRTIEAACSERESQAHSVAVRVTNMKIRPRRQSHRLM